jgi:predicted nucleic acid-binding protein
VLIAENVVQHFSVITLTGKEYSELSLKLGKEGIMGGRSYDLLHLTCAEKGAADRIYTFNIRDFTELGGPLRDKIAAP